MRLSLDDCGRAASFAALRVLPLDELKIDAGFVHGLGRSATDAALVRGLIEIGHALGLDVVAEGVETREAWNMLGAWGCKYAQGFYVATPRSADDLVEWLRAALARCRVGSLCARPESADANSGRAKSQRHPRPLPLGYIGH